MFEGFKLEYVDVGEVTLRARHGGDGPPVVPLHGHPRTQTTWHRHSLAGRDGRRQPRRRLGGCARSRRRARHVRGLPGLRIDRTHEEADRLAGRQIGRARTTAEIRFAVPKQVGDARLR